MTRTKHQKDRPDRVALYARISEDTTGEGSGVDRQMEDMRALAGVRGWQIVQEIPENDVSAWKGVHRPGYQQLMDLVRSRAVDRVLVWHMSRLWRSRPERAADQQAFADAGVSIAAVRGPEIDLTTASGRMLVGLLGEFDSYESDVKAERVEAASRQRAQQGRANGATPYGYEKDTSVIGPNGKPVNGLLRVHPQEGPEVAGIVRQLLDGWSLRQVAADLNDRGVPTPGRSATWTPSSVRKVAVRPGNAGLRVYQGEILGPAAWPAIVTEDEFTKMMSVLTDPVRKTNIGNESERKHLLTYGVGECGVCGGRLRVSRKGRPGKRKTALYVCDVPGCVGRGQDSVDDLVRDVVLARLAEPDAAEILTLRPRPVETAPDADVDELRRRQVDAAQAYARGVLTIDQLVNLTATLESQITVSTRTTTKAGPTDSSQVARLISSKDARTAWDKRMTVAQRRTVVEWLFTAVRIMPTTRRGPGFDPESVQFVWREVET